MDNTRRDLMYLAASRCCCHGRCRCDGDPFLLIWWLLGLVALQGLAILVMTYFVQILIVVGVVVGIVGLVLLVASAEKPLREH